MKTFAILGILGILGMVLSGCGTDTRTEYIPVPEKEDFFAEYYADCVELCGFCEDWAPPCGFLGYNYTLCIDHMWDYGVTNFYCRDAIDKVKGWINDGDCVKAWVEDGDKCQLGAMGFLD